MKTSDYRLAVELAKGLAATTSAEEIRNMGFGFLNSGCYRKVYTHPLVPTVVFKKENRDNSNDMDLPDFALANKREADIYRYVVSRGLRQNLKFWFVPVYYITPCHTVSVQQYEDRSIDGDKAIEAEWLNKHQEDAEGKLLAIFKDVYGQKYGMQVDLHEYNVCLVDGHWLARDYSGAYVYE